MNERNIIITNFELWILNYLVPLHKFLNSKSLCMNI